MEPARKLQGGAVNPAIIPHRLVRLMDEKAQVGLSVEAACEEPRIELIRDGATIKAIDINCTCGRRIRLNCVYRP